MTVDERDQWQCLQDDWSPLYHFTLSDDENDALPFKAAPYADPETPLEAPSPSLLRELVRENHARRTAAETHRKTR